jgi:POT family proton-dependent oligopeptide transporter
MWLMVYFAVLTVGEVYLSPISQSLYSKASPPQIVSTMMAVNFLPNFLGGGFLQGWLGSFWSSMGKVEFFLMIAAIAAVAGAGVLAFSRPLKRLAQE